MPKGHVIRDVVGTPVRESTLPDPKVFEPHFPENYLLTTALSLEVFFGFCSLAVGLIAFDAVPLSTATGAQWPAPAAALLPVWAKDGAREGSILTDK